MTEPTPMQRSIVGEALEWHALQREGGLSPKQQARFMEWLVASPEHLREYLAVGRLAAELADAMRALPTDAPAARTNTAHGNVIALPARRTRAIPKPRPRPRPHRMRRIAVAAMALLAVGIGMHLAWPRTSHYVAAHGEPRRIELPDGTVAHLNAESALRVRLGVFERRLELERGQASFVVAPDRRPLTVHAAGLEVHDIGTTFDVSLLREQARIGVTEGRVQVIGDDGAGRVLADLGAGQSARVAYRDRTVSLRDEDADAMTAWWSGRIVFHDEPLRDVADQFNRRNDVRLYVDDAAGAMRLTGNLRADDLASMRAFLDQQPMLMTIATANGIEVRARTRPDVPALRH
ncbi:FecR family protein [Lysobacter arvi]|uniref:FecR domain-containing protein n=1 Tax=Lysobacter arvi TaxID=3038776 RepID=A0ABU1CD43_9GAMM|nr:FecR domain-containing protein [Lysobacter arvi]MDR0182090.1 FecR domain-containing protein [Lysobacter arvi]